MTDTPTPPDGWYPDPAGGGGLRRWNGTSWTDEVRSAHGEPNASTEGADAAAHDGHADAAVADDTTPHDDPAHDDPAHDDPAHDFGAQDGAHGHGNDAAVGSDASARHDDTVSEADAVSPDAGDVRHDGEQSRGSFTQESVVGHDPAPESPGSGLDGVNADPFGSADRRGESGAADVNDAHESDPAQGSSGAAAAGVAAGAAGGVAAAGPASVHDASTDSGATSSSDPAPAYGADSAPGTASGSAATSDAGANAGAGATQGSGATPVAGVTPGLGSAPGYGSTPGSASTPGYGSTPDYGGAPAYASAPGYGSAPAYGSAPGYPSAPAYPGSTPAGYDAAPRRDIKTNTVWIWLIVALPLVSVLSLFLFDWGAYIRDSVYAEMTSGVMGGPSMAGSLLTVVASLASLVIAALSVVFAFLDWRQLRARGVDRPFHWAWIFTVLAIGTGLVYVIGRGVILRRRTGSGLAPVWAAIGVTVVSIIVGSVWLVMIMSQVFSVIQELQYMYGY